MTRSTTIFSACVCAGLLLFASAELAARDTVRVSFPDFVEMARSYSSELEAREGQVELARNRLDRARASRILPNLELVTAHGLVPGVKSFDPELSSSQYYLDPNLENDWENWGIFTQAEVSGIQPIYTWGAVTNAINAAQKGVEAARYEFEAEKETFVLQMFELYQSALLVTELERLVRDAQSQLDEAEKELERLRDEGDPSIEEKDVFEFYIFREEFQAMREEVAQTRNFVFNAWNILLANNGQRVYLPQERFLDPVPQQLQDLSFYESAALQNRAELSGIAAAEEAAQFGVKAARAQYYPSLVLGLSAGMGYTPNRPRQTNPFIRNNTNFMSARVGFGFRQNLNFWQVNNSVQRSRIQRQQVRDTRDAATDGIRLELGDRYRDARVTESRRRSKSNALDLSNEWLRTEQIDFDLGFGDIKNLVDAVKKKMELEVEVTELTFNLNMRVARLHRAAGLPLFELMPGSNAASAP
ncbi:TolC family protein [Balneolales bacterium ANBcel1]|nr:TolC family protein [Balneolales bacterium ANBcel1]